jgi:twitching motility protein PilT
MKINITKILEETLERNISDLHFSIGARPFIRVSGQLMPLEEYDPLSIDDIEGILMQLLEDQQREIFEINKELDFSVSLGTKARVRVNAFYQKGYPSLALRVIPIGVPRLGDLNLPPTLENLCDLRQGLVLVVGPTGQGKSTTVAAMIDLINEKRAEHIVTIEDPIEYMFINKKSLIEQREMYLDTHSWDVALKSSLRQDPNIVVIGEMRDPETMDAALRISETGHLVFASLHTNSAAQTIERIISSFSQERRAEVSVLLSYVLEVVISQRLVIGRDGNLYPAVEIMLGSEAVKNLIREGKSHMLDNIISTSAQMGMISLEKSLSDLVNRGLVDPEEAMKYTSKPELLRRLLK